MTENKLDVLMITYNHQDFIKEAINGVIKQKTNFKYRLLIFDDCSSDQTEQRIRKSILHNNFNLEIIYKRNKKNLGALVNGFQAFQAANSKYIALCEGDDYWIDPYKLQKQVDFLETNLDYSICFTNVYELYDNKYKNSSLTKIIGSQKDYNTNLERFLSPYFFYTSSSTFRNIPELKQINRLKYFKDIFLFSILMKHGDLYLINQLSSVYRIHSNGIWSMKSKVSNLISNISTFGEMSKYHKYKITLINESYLWGLIDLNYLEGVKYKFRINCFLKFVKFCFRKPKYFKLLFRDFLRL